MAVIAKTISVVSAFGERSHVITWGPLANSDSGDPVEMPGSSDRSIQVTGTFGVAGNVRIEGSNDGTNYAVLSDPQGTALDIITTDPSIEGVLEITRWIRPRVTSGDGTTALTVSMLLVRK